MFLSVTIIVRKKQPRIMYRNALGMTEVCRKIHVSLIPFLRIPAATLPPIDRLSARRFRPVRQDRATGGARWLASESERTDEGGEGGGSEEGERWNARRRSCRR